MLDPRANRTLHWASHDAPFPAPLVVGSSQPLYGMNVNMRPLYERTRLTTATGSCTVPSGSDLCRAAARNLPMENWEPALVVWPTTEAQVQTAVRFARDHELCVSVAGTGHDFLNRHSCNNGLMIRTSLLKAMDWSLDGVVKLGAGLTFSEITKAGSEQRPPVFTSTGWSSSVGIAGWSLGGGHGPLAPSVGTGVDNIVEVELVTANGDLVTANERDHPDLLWAMRGGGGSAWGVMTAITVRKHPTPPGGFTQLVSIHAGSYSQSSEADLLKVVAGAFDWASGLSEKWGGIIFVSGNRSAWELLYVYWYTGAKTDAEFARRAALLRGPHTFFQREETHKNWWLANPSSTEVALASTTSIPGQSAVVHELIPSRREGGDVVPSVLLNRTLVEGARFREEVAGWLSDRRSAARARGQLMAYNDLAHPSVSGRLPASATSTSGAWHEAMLHLVVPPDAESMRRFLPLAEHSYFGESAYVQEGDSWKARYWGANYDELLAVKRRYDPENMFWCHNCVGSDLPRNLSKPAVLV